jgi:hypothetical protein
MVSTTTLATFASKYTYAGVITVDSVTGTAGTFADDAVQGDSAGYNGIVLQNSSGTYNMRVYHWDGGAKYAGPATFSLATKLYYVVRWDGAGTPVRLRVNGAADVSSANANALATTTGAMRLARMHAGAKYFDGKIHEALAYSSYISGGDLTKLESYLAGV